MVVKILRKLFKTLGEEEKILMTASTHNGMSLSIKQVLDIQPEHFLSSCR